MTQNAFSEKLWAGFPSPGWLRGMGGMQLGSQLGAGEGGVWFTASCALVADDPSLS